MGKYKVKHTTTGYCFNLVATNGQVIATSQVYHSLRALRVGVRSVVKNAEEANVEDQTKEDFEAKKNPKFEVYLDKGGKPRFRLKAKNGQVIASSEAYESLDNCLKGVESVKKNASDPIIVGEE